MVDLTTIDNYIMSSMNARKRGPAVDNGYEDRMSRDQRSIHIIV